MTQICHCTRSTLRLFYHDYIPYRTILSTPPPPTIISLTHKKYSVQELIDAAPGDVECPTCSEPLTVDLSGGSPGAKNEDVGEEGEGEQNDGGHRGHGRRPKGARSKKISCGVARGGRGRGGGLTAKGRIAGMVAALEASIKKAPKEKPKGGFTKRSVTKHSVINRIDLNKFQSVRF